MWQITKVKPGSWCNDPNCTAFEFDAVHLQVQMWQQSAVQRSGPTDRLLGGGGDIYAAATGGALPWRPLPSGSTSAAAAATAQEMFNGRHQGRERREPSLHKGVAHMFHQGGGGWLHYVSNDFISWNYNHHPPGGRDGSLTLLRCRMVRLPR